MICDLKWKTIILILFNIFSFNSTSYGSVSAERARYLMSSVFDEYKNEINQLSLPFDWEFRDFKDRSSQTKYNPLGGSALATVAYKKNEQNIRVAINYAISLSSNLTHFPEANDDTVLLTICHELGHILAGKPYSQNSLVKYPGHSLSAEGMADYFAASKCLKRMFKTIPQPENALRFKDSTNFCTDANDPVICERIINTAITSRAALGHSDTYSGNIGKISLNKILHFSLLPAAKTTNIKSHPSSACRIKTSIVGSRCNADIYSDKICEEDFKVGGGLDCWYKAPVAHQ